MTDVRAADNWADDLYAFIDMAMDYLTDRKHAYCVCFEGGTFCCIDCATSRQCRTIYNIKKELPT